MAQTSSNQHRHRRIRRLQHGRTSGAGPHKRGNPSRVHRSEIQFHDRRGREIQSGESHEGGISGFFHRLFGGDEEHGHYAEAVRRGSAVVCVTAPQEQLDQAVEIMNSAGAVDIDRRVASYRETGYERHDPNAPPYSYDDAVRERERIRGAEEGMRVPVVEEEIEVGKRAVKRGGVRVYSHVVEKPVEENIELREEHVNVERRPADRPVESGDMARMRDQSVEVTEMAEEPVVQQAGTRSRGGRRRQRNDAAHRADSRHRAPDRGQSRADGRRRRPP